MGNQAILCDEETRALIDFVRQNSTGLSGLTKATAKSVLQCLMDEDMCPSPLLTRVVRSSDPRELFAFLYEAIETQQPERRHQLLDAIAELPNWVWAHWVLGHRCVADRYDRAEDFAYLLKNHRTALLYGQDYVRIMEAFSSDKYWLRRVRRCIAKGNFRRAWDELGKAERGFFIGGKEHIPRFGKCEPEYYRFAATRDTIATLESELHEAMVQRGILPAISGAQNEQVTSIMFAVKEYFRNQRNARRRERIGLAMP